MKSDFTSGKVLNGKREPIVFNFIPGEPYGLKNKKNTKKQNHKEHNIPNNSNITVYIEDVKYRKVDLDGETKSFNLQLMKNCEGEYKNFPTQN